MRSSVGASASTEVLGRAEPDEVAERHRYEDAGLDRQPFESPEDGTLLEHPVHREAGRQYERDPDGLRHDHRDHRDADRREADADQ